MQKSENKIKPMYFWSDGYDEYGVLGPNPKKPVKDELEADVSDSEENEFLFKRKEEVKKGVKEKRFKRFCNKMKERLRKHDNYW